MNNVKNFTKNNKDITVAIISWDATHNAFGRAYMLAEALSMVYKVHLIGFSFNKKEYNLWEPLKNCSIPITIIPGSKYPNFTNTLKDIASQIEADVVLVSKLRMPSVHLGLLMKAYKSCPLIIDIDDYELGFFIEKKINTRDRFRLSQVSYNKKWTSFAESLIGYADHILVSNHALQKKYGGTVIPHARNENKFNPKLYNKEKRREQLGISLEDKIVMFFGTPRRHKGLANVLKALMSYGNPYYKLCIMGSFLDNEYKTELENIGRKHLLLFPNQPFQEAAHNIIIGDVVCLLQDQDSIISKYQLPAKAVDAFAMGLPILAYRVPPLEILIEQKVIIPTTNNNLNRDLIYVLERSEEIKESQLKKRDIFLRDYSYSSIVKKMENIFNDSLSKPKKLPENVLTKIDKKMDMLYTLVKLKNKVKNICLRSKIL